MKAMLGVAVLSVVSGCVHSPGVEEPPRGRAFWLELKEKKFELADASQREAVFHDAEALVDNPDGVLRDDVGYGLVAAWVYRGHLISAPALTEFVTHLLERMKAPGVSGLGRSFAALSLSLVAASDVQQQALAPEVYASMVDAAVTALDTENDLRGHHPELGWIHATAHTADLLKFLTRDPRLTPAQLEKIRDVMLRRLTRGPAFSWGEDERLASALRAVVLKSAVPAEVLAPWLGTLPPAWKALWSAPVLDRAAFTHLNNTKQLLRALLVGLVATPDSPQLEPLRTQVLETLLELQ